MLVQFKFNNFRCFREETILSMVASDDERLLMDNCVRFHEYTVLKGAVVYGANASGKTKLFQAFNFMRRVVTTSAQDYHGWKSAYVPFLLGENRGIPSSFEVIFILEGVQYRYGFETDGKVIQTEWLFRKLNVDYCILYREGNHVEYKKRYIKDIIANNIISAKMIRPDSLALSALAVWNEPLCCRLVTWFHFCNVLSASSNSFAGYSLSQLMGNRKEQIVSFMKSADFNILDLEVKETNINEVPEEIRRLMTKEKENGIFVDGVSALHKRYDEQGRMLSPISFSMESDESYGTYRMFALSAPIIDTLENGKVLWVDEIDNGLHHALIRNLVSLFHDPEMNPHNAQLIINTHNIDLIDDKHVYRRDQINISEKNRYGESRLYNLCDINLDERDSFGQLYREGRLGGTPYLTDFMSNVLKRGVKRYGKKS